MKGDPSLAWPDDLREIFDVYRFLERAHTELRRLQTYPIPVRSKILRWAQKHIEGGYLQALVSKHQGSSSEEIRVALTTTFDLLEEVGNLLQSRVDTWSQDIA